MQKQTRREFLKKAGVATLAAGGLSMYSNESFAQPDGRQQPDILFIICDQLAAHALSCYGGPVQTPNIDRLAGEGIRFTQATCVTPYCSPTRASIVTGRYPHAHGIVLNCAPRRQEGIHPHDITTEKILSDAGYKTHHYGKWHLDGDKLPYYPDMFRPWFEYAEKMQPVFDKVRMRDPSTYMNWYKWLLPVEIDPRFQKAVDALGDRWNGRGLAEFITKMGRLKLPLSQCYDVQVADLTCKRLNDLRLSSKPFMITCSFNWPHDPNVVPSPYYEMFDPDEIKLPANHVREERFEKDWSCEIVRGLGERGMREFLRIYYGMVKLIDDQVGKVLSALEKTGRMDGTVIVFTADHGDMMGSHGMVWKSNHSFYEEVVRVPLIIRYPKKFKPQVSDIPTDSTDLMPTLLELTGKSIPSVVQGQSLVPFLTGQRDNSLARQFAFSERIRGNPKGRRKVLPGTKGSFMIRGKGYKLARYENGQVYLYDLKKDPGETKNRADDPAYQAILKELSTELDNWFERTKSEEG
jgi:arylsulfatase A-like enzyme